MESAVEAGVRLQEQGARVVESVVQERGVGAARALALFGTGQDPNMGTGAGAALPLSPQSARARVVACGGQF